LAIWDRGSNLVGCGDAQMVACQIVQLGGHAVHGPLRLLARDAVLEPADGVERTPLRPALS